MTYDPQKHHRRSIRLQGHDYSGGGDYFVTACAHREFIGWAGGKPFHAPGVRELLEEEWGKCGEIRDDVFPGPMVVMPDHFHGLVRIAPGASELGRVVGGFKAAVSRRIRRGDLRMGDLRMGDLQIARTGNPQMAPHAQIRIWHRNYYERIVRSEAERAAIEKYIALNPARLVFALDGMAAFGNPVLWEMEKIGVLASGKGPVGSVPAPKPGWAWLSGFHSAQEEGVLNATDAPAIRMAAVGPGQVGLTPLQMERLAEGRLLVLCPFEEPRTTRANALARNRLVAEKAGKLWIPAARPGGSLEQLSREFCKKLLP